MTLDVYTGPFGDDLDTVASPMNGIVQQMCNGGAKRTGQDEGADNAHPA